MIKVTKWMACDFGDDLYFFLKIWAASSGPR
jgi:hypothetical protein